MRTRIRPMAILAAVLAGLWTAPLTAQDAMTKHDRQGPVTVALTLLTSPGDGSPMRVKVVLDTHSVALDGITLQQAVVLLASDGREVTPEALEAATGGGHHRQAILVFPPGVAKGSVRIVVRNVGGVAERTFTWDVVR